ncbi:hypothetical protein D910_01947, partial [Dendroctonus ponderosae]
MVHNKSAALGACAFTVTEENQRVINFTDPISIQAYTFLAARPRELSRALLFISPFRGDTWLCLSATIISMGPVLFYIHKLSPVYEYKGVRCKGGLATIQNCIWYMYGALLQQGGMHLPYADSARIIVGSWWLVVLVIGTTYCGNLVAYLTFPKIEVPMTTIDDVLAHKEMVSWSYAKNTLFEARLHHGLISLPIASLSDHSFDNLCPMAFDIQGDAILASVFWRCELLDLDDFQRMMAAVSGVPMQYNSVDKSFNIIFKDAKNIWDRKAMMGEIKSGKHVYIDWKIKLQYMIKEHFIDSGECSFALGVEEFCEEQIALIVAPDTPYLHKINEEIKKLHQVGLIQKWLSDYLPKKDKCWKKKRTIEVNNHTVNLDDMQGSFFVLF